MFHDLLPSCFRTTVPALLAGLLAAAAPLLTHAQTARAPAVPPPAVPAKIAGNGAVRDALRVRPGDAFNLHSLQKGLPRMADIHLVCYPQSPPGAIVAGPGTPTVVDYGGKIGDVIVVPVRVDDRATGHFLLVTNSSQSYVSKMFAASLGLTPRRMTQEVQPASAVSLDRMVVGGASGVDLKGVSLPVTDLSGVSRQMGQAVDGLLGADLLSRTAFAIDFPRRRVTFWDHGGLSAAERHAAGFDGALSAALAPTGDRLPVFADAVRIRNGAAAVEARMVIATGYAECCLPATDTAALRMKPLPDASDPANLLSRATRLTVGGLSLTAPKFQITNEDGVTLGRGILEDYRLLLDEPAHMAYFAPEVRAAGADPDRRSLAVPFRFDPVTTLYPIVMVSINGRPPLPFVFDTGCGYALVIDRRAVRALGLTEDPQSATLVNNTVPAGTAAVATAVVRGRTPADDLRISLEQAVVMDLSAVNDAIIAPRIAGLIGAPVLRDTAVRIDYPHRTLTFLPDHPDLLAPRGATVLPLTEGARDNIYLVTLRPVAGPPVRLVVDTGNPDTDLPFEMMKSLRPLHDHRSGQWMLGSMQLGQDLTLSRPPFGWMPSGPLTVGVRPAADGLAGTPAAFFVRRGGHALTVRFRRTDYWHEPPSPLDGLFGFGRAADPFVVSGVLPGSAAARAGLAPGDMITAINGQATSGVTPEQWQTLLLETRLTLTVTRKGASRTVVLAGGTVPQKR